MDLVRYLHIFTICKLYHVNLYCIDILKLRNYELTYSVFFKYLLSLKLSSPKCELYKPSELVGSLKNVFNSMLNLGLSFLRVVGDHKIYT